MKRLPCHHIVVCQSGKIHSPDTDKNGHLGKMPSPNPDKGRREHSFLNVRMDFSGSMYLAALRILNLDWGRGSVGQVSAAHL